MLMHYIQPFALLFCLTKEVVSAFLLLTGAPAISCFWLPYDLNLDALKGFDPSNSLCLCVIPSVDMNELEAGKAIAGDFVFLPSPLSNNWKFPEALLGGWEIPLAELTSPKFVKSLSK